MEKSPNANFERPSALLPLAASLPHSANAKPATKHSAAPRATTILYASPPSLANEARAKGSSLGAGFATLTAQDFDRASDMVNAIETGLHNAERQKDYERSIMNDEAALINMGFYGRSENDD